MVIFHSYVSLPEGIQCEVDFKYVFTVRFDPLREQLVADVFLFLERLESKIQGGAP